MLNRHDKWWMAVAATLVFGVIVQAMLVVWASSWPNDSGTTLQWIFGLMTPTWPFLAFCLGFKADAIEQEDKQVNAQRKRAAEMMGQNPNQVIDRW